MKVFLQSAGKESEEVEGVGVGMGVLSSKQLSLEIYRKERG